MILGIFFQDYFISNSVSLQMKKTIKKILFLF